MSNYLAIDVGGTYIKYALCDGNAEFIEKDRVPTPDNFDDFLNCLKELYDKYSNKNIEAIVMSAPGRIDANNGYFYTSGALGYISGINLKDKLQEIIPVDFAVENDAKAAAAAEIWKGSMQGVTNGCVIVLGTGLGGALIIDGKLYRGSTFAAGEISCVSTDLTHDFGSNGATWATPCGIRALMKEYATKAGVDESEVTGQVLFAKAEEGDENALEAIRHYCQILATGIISMQHIIDVEKIAIGGGISAAPLLLKTLQEELDRQFSPYKGLLPATLPEIVKCTFGNDANMIGALYHYLYEIKG